MGDDPGCGASLALGTNINDNSKLKLRKDQKRHNNETNRRMANVTRLSTRFEHRNDFHMYEGRIPI